MRKNVLSRKLAMIIVAFMFLFVAHSYAQPRFVKLIPKGSKNFVSNSEKIYFSVSDTLWISDGTATGTYAVKKLGEPIETISEIKLGSLVFIRTSTPGGKALWKSDGTVDGTTKVGAFPYISPAAVYNDVLYVNIDDGVHGNELWKFTPPSTLTMLKDINPGVADGFFGENNGYAFGITLYNGYLYFKAQSIPNEFDIWKTDGTPEGTVLAADVPFETFGELKASDGLLYFTQHYEGYYGPAAALHKTLGTTESIELVYDFESDYPHNQIYRLTELNGKTYFLRDSGIPSHDLWVTDGTPGTTMLVENVGMDGGVSEFILVKNNLVFHNESQGFPGPIFRSDGTAAGTYHFYNYKNGYGYDYTIDMFQLTSTGDMLFFTDIEQGYYGSASEMEIYQSDLTPSGTKTLKEIYNNPAFRGSFNLTASGETIFFTSGSGDPVLKLWWYDPSSGTGALCDNTGGVTRETWRNVNGTTTSTVPVNTTPTETENMTTFDGPQNIGDHYGSRYRAWLCVSVTGDYRFWIASNDNSDLFLSTDDTPANKVRIAYVNGATNPGQYNKYASQQSALIRLEQGKAYYIEALHKEGVGTDHVSVGMQLPDGTLERPITGARLVTFTGTVPNTPPQVTLVEPSKDVYPKHQYVPFSATASDTDGNVELIEFFVDNRSIGVDTEAPYEATWYAFYPGMYEVYAQAVDNDGAITKSTSRFIEVVEGCSGAGSITREVWYGVQGVRVTDIPLNSPPHEKSNITIFEAPSNIGDHYGTRIRGYVCAPVTGTYYFYIASNDYSELYLSTDTYPENKTRIAYVNGATSPRQYDKYFSQQSVAITLEQHRQYYIEALHKEGVGTDHVSVGWRYQVAENQYTNEMPIPGNRLSPFEPNANMAAREKQIVALDTEEQPEVHLSPNPVSLQPVTMTLRGYGSEISGGSMKVQIASVIGSVIKEQTFECAQGCDNVQLETQNLSQGVYVVNGVLNGKKFSRRLIVK